MKGNKSEKQWVSCQKGSLHLTDILLKDRQDIENKLCMRFLSTLKVQFVAHFTNFKYKFVVYEECVRMNCFQTWIEHNHFQLTELAFTSKALCWYCSAIIRKHIYLVLPIKFGLSWGYITEMQLIDCDGVCCPGDKIAGSEACSLPLDRQISFTVCIVEKHRLHQAIRQKQH